MTATATLIDELKNDSPDAAALAELASAAVSAEAALLRRLRLRMLPRASPAAEADLWFSNLVKTAGVRGLVFDDDVLATLRRQLSRDRVRARRACAIVKEIHAGHAPLVRLEEELIAASLIADEDATDRIQGLLERILATIAAEPGRADGIALWAARSIPNLPAAVRDAEAARLLDTATRIRRGRLPEVSGASPQATELAYLLPQAADTVTAGVRLFSGAAEVTIPPAAGTLTLPITGPRVLRVGSASPVIASGGWVGVDEGTTVIAVEPVVIRNTANLDEVASVVPGGRPIAVALQSGGAQLAIGRDDGVVEVWPLEGNAPRLVQLPSVARGLVFPVHSNRLVVACEDSIVRLVDDDPIELLEDVEPAPFAAYAERVAAVRDGAVVVRLSGREVVNTVEGEGRCTALALTEREVAAGFEDGGIVVWTSPSWEATRVLALDVSQPRALAFSPSGRFLAAAGRDGGLAICDRFEDVLISTGDLDDEPTGLIWIGEESILMAGREALHLHLGRSPHEHIGASTARSPGPLGRAPGVVPHTALT